MNQLTILLSFICILGGAALLPWLCNFDFSRLTSEIFVFSETTNNDPVDVEAGSCDSATYTTELLSLDPLIVYINNFLTEQEIEDLLALGNDSYIDSTVADDPDSRFQHPSRTSSTAYLPAHAPVVNCVTAKARAFLGFYDFDGIETPQLTRYTNSQEYRAHFDWPPSPWRDPAHGNMRFDRFATFFVYLETTCTGGSTHFPRVFIDDIPHLDALDNSKFEAISGDSESERTVNDDRGDKEQNRSLAIRAVAGNAVFWVNMKEKATGHDKTFHAGMPVTEGTKVGLNIWSRRYLTDEEETIEADDAKLPTLSTPYRFLEAGRL